MLEINIERNHDNSVTLSTILDNKQRHSKKYFGYKVADAVAKFESECTLKNRMINNYDNNSDNY